MKNTTQQSNAVVLPISLKNYQQPAPWLMLVTAALLLVLTSCKKDRQLPAPDQQNNQSVHYIDLGNREIHYNNGKSYRQ
jgi:hypothetical protein